MVSFLKREAQRENVDLDELLSKPPQEVIPYIYDKYRKFVESLNHIHESQRGCEAEEIFAADIPNLTFGRRLPFP